MAVTPQGPMSIALAKAREIVAACPEFIAQTNSSDAAFIDDRPGDLDLTIWATVFEYSGDTDYEVTRLKSERGSTMLSLFRQRPEEYAASKQDALMDFRNFAGVVVTQILELSKQPIAGGADWYLGVVKIRQVIPASWCQPNDEEEADPFLMATFHLEWV